MLRRMNLGEPGRTALIVAGARAAHLRFDPPPHLLEDGLAERLLGEQAEALIAMHAEPAPWIRVENRLFLPFRGRFAEDQSAFLKGVGEPPMNRYRPSELEGALLGAGFARVELPSRDALRRRYFEPLASRIPTSERFGLAIAWR
jgi:O-methyltransferase involved in polyketide biosynthesis